MSAVQRTRLAAPKEASGLIVRQSLIDAVAGSDKDLTYIHAGAGFGKTTLLSQIAGSYKDAAVWLTLDGESDALALANALYEAIRFRFPDCSFNASEYLLFEGKENYSAILANALISIVENISGNLIIILDDLHTIKDPQAKKLIASLLKYKPPNLRFCFSSREALWQEFVPQYARGNILELTQEDLKFSRSEASQILDIDDENIYSITEGWPIAVGSFRVLRENGVSLAEMPVRGKEVLFSYLFFECISRLPSEIVDFLKATACFDELDPRMLAGVLDIKNAELILESLVSQNIFTIKVSGGQYRYHALFREYLLKGAEDAASISLLKKAASYYFSIGQYSKAAEYAIRLENKEILEQIILTCYKEYIRSGSFNELRQWFQALGDTAASLRKELLVAEGAFLSSIGNFTKANMCLDMAIPMIKKDDRELYIEAMVHKARVLRNYISFEESNKLLDGLIDRLDDFASELSYTVIIEKIYNLCWNSQINEADALTGRMIEACAKAGNLKVKARFERYLSVVHFLAGRMKEAVYYYEKSLALPEHERQYLSMHSVDIYVAKAYQMLGERDKAVSVVTAELQMLRSAGRYEELWLGYLFAAEIHYQNTFIDRMNGGSQSFETTMKYFTLADEYAPLYRKTDFQMVWAKMQRNIYSLMFKSKPNQDIINEIWANLDKVGDYFKTIALARLLSYYGTVSDFANAVKCATLCVEIGERSNMMLMATGAYGMLARAAIISKDHEKAAGIIRRFLQLCDENGFYEYFRMRKAYDPVLEFALDNGIEPEFTKQMMDFAGYRPKKAYVETLGAFAVYHDKDRQKPLKFRSKKERELFAFLLDAGSQGVTKEQIYNAIWWDSDSADVKSLISVNLAHIKNDFIAAGIENPIINQEKRYSIRRDEIAADTDLFEEAARDLLQNGSRRGAQTILSLYRGEYLSDFEAHWAVARRLKFAEVYNKALSFMEK